MILNVPKRPTGSGDAAVWFTRVHDRVFKEVQPIDSPTVKWSVGPGGWVARAIVPPSTAQAPSSPIILTSVLSEEEDTILCGGVVTSITITNAGTGLGNGTFPITFTGGGGGTGAAGTFTVTGGSITSVNLTDGGSGYAVAPGVDFSAAGGSVVATGTAIVPPPISVAKPPPLQGFVSTQSLITMPLIFSYGDASAYAILGTVGDVTGVIIDVILLNGGSDYSGSTPIITFPTAGTGGNVTATINGTEVTALTLVAGGHGYTGVTDSVYILDPYLPGDPIFYCQPQGGTGLNDVIYQDLNVAARKLATSLSTCENLSGNTTQMNRLFVCSPPFAPPP